MTYLTSSLENLTVVEYLQVRADDCTESYYRRKKYYCREVVELTRQTRYKLYRQHNLARSKKYWFSQLQLPHLKDKLYVQAYDASSLVCETASGLLPVRKLFPGVVQVTIHHPIERKRYTTNWPVSICNPISLVEQLKDSSHWVTTGVESTKDTCIILLNLKQKTHFAVINYTKWLTAIKRG
jgi:hypothetical protein